MHVGDLVHMKWGKPGKKGPILGGGEKKLLIGQAELEQHPVSKAAIPHLYVLTEVERPVP